MSDALRLLDHPLASSLGWTLVRFVWQGAVIGLIAFFLLRVLRPAQASTRYMIGVATLAVMLLAPIATFMSGVGTPDGLPFSSERFSGDVGSAASLVTGSIFSDASGNPGAA